MATVNTITPSLYNDDNERQKAALSFIEILFPYFEEYNGFDISDTIRKYKALNNLDYNDGNLQSMHELKDLIKGILIANELAMIDPNAKFYIKLTTKGRFKKLGKDVDSEETHGIFKREELKVAIEKLAESEQRYAEKMKNQLKEYTEKFKPIGNSPINLHVGDVFHEPKQVIKSEGQSSLSIIENNLNASETINNKPQTNNASESKRNIISIISDNKTLSGIIVIVFSMIIKKLITGKWF